MDDDKRLELEKLGESTVDSIVELVDALHKAEGDDDQDAIDEAETAIYEDALSVEVRCSEWTSPGAMEADEYRILLGWGGPAMQIRGELYRGRPDTAVVEVQDWFIPWTPYNGTTEEEDEKLLEYAQKFCFEG